MSDQHIRGAFNVVALFVVSIFLAGAILNGAWGAAAFLVAVCSLLYLIHRRK